ncbi:MAG: hypothetical protein ABEJ88_04085 [Halobacterium sp.]
MTAALDRWRPAPETAAAFVALCALELAALAAYLWTAPVSVTAPRYVLYPFAWLNAAALAVWRVRLPDGSRRRRVGTLAVGAGYFLALAWVGGVLGPSHGSGVAVYWRLPPGWGPLVISEVGPIRAVLAPYKVAGYLALAYLVGVAVLDADAGLAGGLVGAFSCVSCTLPLLATAVSSVAGGAVAFGSAAAWSYDLSTAAFLLAVALLVWRPDIGALGRLR